MPFSISIGGQTNFRRKFERIDQTLRVVSDDDKISENIVRSRELVKLVTAFIKKVYPRSSEHEFTHRFKPGAKRPSKIRRSHIADGWRGTTAAKGNGTRVFVFYHAKYGKDEAVTRAIDVIEQGKSEAQVTIPKGKVYRYWNFRENEVSFIKGVHRLVIPARKPQTDRNLSAARRQLDHLMKLKTEKGMTDFLKKWANA